jgi:hypothetical protein
MVADVAEERLFANWFDPIETAARRKVRGFIELLVEEEVEERNPAIICKCWVLYCDRGGMVHRFHPA